jgi:hypothetical protein
MNGASVNGMPAAVSVGEDQPLEARLAFGTELHRDILARLNARRELSERHIKSRYDDWDQVDEHCRLFIDLSRNVKRADRTSRSDKKEMPFERAIVVPMSLAILTVRLTQLLAIFGAREPMLQYEGRGPEDVRPAKLMEALVAYDLQQTSALLVQYALCQDAEKYGLGVVHDVWEEEHGWTMKTPPMARSPIAPLLARMGLGSLLRPQQAWGKIREYNRWEPVDPFHYWPDPRVPASQVQQGEFVGHRVFRGAMHLKERDQANGGPYFNLEHLKAIASGSERTATSRNKFAQEQFSLKNSARDDEAGFYAIDHMQVYLVPREWKLGPSDRPEKWWFSWADDKLIVRAHKSSYGHGQFTYAVAESNPDEHALFNQGSIENLDGLQRVINWLVNSHVDNVRKHLNDVLIYAPSLVEESDIINPGPARHIRLTAAGEKAIAEGRSTFDQMIKQLPWADVTGQHLRTVAVLQDMAQRLAATSDPQMSSTTDDKRTLGEVQQVIASSSQRIAIVARLMDSQALSPLATRAVANRQQFTSAEQFVRVTGDLARETGGAARLLIKPTDVAGNFDYVPHSGAIPPDPARFAAVWQKILEGAAKIPQLLEPGPDGKALDVREVFNEAVRSLGIKNVGQFYYSVSPDELLLRAVAAGNAVPADAANEDGKVPGAGIQTPITPVGIDLAQPQPNGAQ